MNHPQAVVKLGAGSRVGSSVPRHSGGAFQRGVGCPQLLHGRPRRSSTFTLLRSHQTPIVMFTLDQYRTKPLRWQAGGQLTTCCRDTRYRGPEWAFEGRARER